MRVVGWELQPEGLAEGRRMGDFEDVAISFWGVGGGEGRGGCWPGRDGLGRGEGERSENQG